MDMAHRPRHLSVAMRKSPLVASRKSPPLECPEPPGKPPGTATMRLFEPISVEPRHRSRDMKARVAAQEPRPPDFSPIAGPWTARNSRLDRYLRSRGHAGSRRWGRAGQYGATFEHGRVWLSVESIQNPSEAGLVTAVVLLVIPFSWPLSLYMFLRYATGHRAVEVAPPPITGQGWRTK
jgi:hypothetical protein